MVTGWRRGEESRAEGREGEGGQGVKVKGGEGRKERRGRGEGFPVSEGPGYGSDMWELPCNSCTRSVFLKNILIPGCREGKGNFRVSEGPF